MYKNVLLILVAAAFMWACDGQNAAKEEVTTQEEVVVEEATALSLAEFQDKAEALVGKEVIIEGTVIHVCKHGGKKMFITADELEGSYIKVHGIVEAIEAEVVGEGQHAEGEEEHEEDADHKNIYHKPQYSVICISYVVEQAEPVGE